MIFVCNGEVVEVMESFEQLPNGKLINNCIYPFGEVVESEVIADFARGKYLYNETDGCTVCDEWSLREERVAALEIDSLNYLGMIMDDKGVW